MGSACSNSKNKNKAGLESNQNSLNSIYKPVSLFFSNFKIKNSPNNTNYIQIQQGNQKLCTIEQSGTKNPVFKQILEPFELMFIKNDDDLKNNNININVCNKKKKIIGSIQLNLYDIATGPKRHDFEINWNKNSKDNIKYGRITFDIEFSQRITLIIGSQQVVCNLNNIIPKDTKFKFNLKLLTERIDTFLNHQDKLTLVNEKKPQNSLNFQELEQEKQKITSRQLSRANSIIRRSDQYSPTSKKKWATKFDKLKEKKEESEFEINGISEGKQATKQIQNLNTKTIVSKNYQQMTQKSPQQEIELHTLKIDKRDSKYSNDDQSSLLQNQNSLNKAKQTNISQQKNKSVNEVKKIIEAQKQRGIVKQQQLKVQIQQNNGPFYQEDPQIKTPTSIQKQIQIFQWNLFDNINSYDEDEIHNSLCQISLGTKDIKDSQFKLEVYEFIGEQIDGDDQDQDQYKLIGQGFIPLSKLFVSQIDQQQQKNQINQKNMLETVNASSISFNNQLTNMKLHFKQQSSLRLPKEIQIKEFKEKLQIYGKIIGLFQIGFLLNCSTYYLKQIPLKVKTERGIMKNPPQIYTLEGADQDIQQLKTIDNLSKKLYAKTIEFQQNEGFSFEIDAILIGLFEIIKSKNKQIFDYKSKIEKLRGQEQLINLANHLVQYADEMDEQLKQKFYQLLKAVVNRGEFDLPDMGFNQREQGYLIQRGSKDILNQYIENQDQNSNFINNIKQQGQHLSQLQNQLQHEDLDLKIGVVIKYQKLLYLCLQKAINKFNQQDKNFQESQERDFVYNFLAIAYFRIPEFKNRLLNSISNQKDQPLNDIIKLPEEKHIGEKQLHELFDWQGEFYNFIQIIQKGESKIQKQNSLVADEKWQKKFSERGQHFYLFLKEWAQFVNKKLVTQEHIPWSELPGYKTLIKAFFSEIQNQESIVSAYPETMMVAAVKLLNNTKLLNMYLYLFFGKTKVQDSKQTLFCFSLINNCLQYMVKNEKELNSTFDVQFFLEGIKKVLLEDHSESIAKVLNTVTQNYLVLPIEFKKLYNDFIFGPIFFKFFMHWSHTVRLAFYRYLLYRINHQHNPSHSYTAQLLPEQSSRKDSIMNQITKENKQKKVNEAIFQIFQFMFLVLENIKDKLEKIDDEKQLEEKVYYKKMKNKLLERKLQKEQSKQSKTLIQANNSNTQTNNNNTQNYTNTINNGNSTEYPMLSNKTYEPIKQNEQKISEGNIIKWAIKETLVGNVQLKKTRKSQSFYKKDKPSQNIQNQQQEQYHINEADNTSSELQNQSYSNKRFTQPIRGKQPSYAKVNNANNGTCINNNNSIYTSPDININSIKDVEEIQLQCLQIDSKYSSDYPQSNVESKNNRNLFLSNNDNNILINKISNNNQNKSRENSLTSSRIRNSEKDQKSSPKRYVSNKQRSSQQRKSITYLPDELNQSPYQTKQSSYSQSIKKLQGNNKPFNLNGSQTGQQQQQNQQFPINFSSIDLNALYDNNSSEDFDNNQTKYYFFFRKSVLFQKNPEKNNNQSNKTSRSNSKFNGLYNKQNSNSSQFWFLNQKQENDQKSFNIKNDNNNQNQDLNNSKNQKQMNTLIFTKNKEQFEKYFKSDNENTNLKNIEMIYIRNFSQGIKQFMETITEYIQWVEEINFEIQEKFSHLPQQKKLKFFLEYFVPNMKEDTQKDNQEESL